MTNPDTEEVVTAASDGVTVEKSFEPDDFPVPAIAFAFRSDRDEPVSVRLVDSVPDDISPENIGFHPKYGAEFWDVVDDGIAFERELAPGEEYTTVYGLRGEDTDEPSRFLSEPRIESVTPPLDGEDAPEDDADNDDYTDADNGTDIDVDIDTDDDGVDTGTEVDPEPETAVPTDDEDIDTVSIATDDDPGAAEATVGTPEPGPNDESDGKGESGGGDRDPDPDDGGVDDGSVVGELVSELEAADPDDPEVVALREALGIDLTRATVEARIDHLQSAVSDLEAYTDALEEFLDENGGAQQALDDVREQYERTTERLDSIEATAEAANESAQSAETQLDDEFGDVQEDLNELEAEIESLSEELSDVVEMRERLTEALGGIAGGDVSEDD